MMMSSCQGKTEMGGSGGRGGFWKDMTWEAKERRREEISLFQMQLLREIYRDNATAPTFATILGHRAHSEGYSRSSDFRNVPSGTFRARGPCEKITVLEDPGHPPALFQGRKHGQSGHS